MFAAASLRDVLLEVAGAWERERDVPVRFNFAGSNELARQLAAGARADVYFSADDREVTHLENLGLIDRASRRALLSNRLVLVVPERLHASRPADFDWQGFVPERLAIAGAEVPAGIYGRRWLEHRDRWDVLEEVSVSTLDVRAALAAVESEACQAGVCYRTDAVLSDGVRIVLEQGLDEPPSIAYGVCALREAAHPELAREFVRFLEENAARFRSYGFDVRL